MAREFADQAECFKIRDHESPGGFRLSLCANMLQPRAAAAAGAAMRRRQYIYMSLIVIKSLDLSRHTHDICGIIAIRLCDKSSLTSARCRTHTHRLAVRRHRAWQQRALGGSHAAKVPG